MNKVHLPTLTEEELRSPSGKFHSFCKNVSVAFGARRRVNEPGEVHPFDVQQRRLPPGASVCPYHSHAAQWELFIVVSGRAIVRRDGVTHIVTAGSAFIHAPGTTHQMTNASGTDDLVVWIVADNPLVDVFHYPDSAKFGTRPLGKYFRIQEVDYLAGEDDEPAPAPTPSNSAPMARAREAFEVVSIDALPWSEAKSPTGKFRSYFKDISVRLGAKRNAIAADGGHPFDLQLRRVPPGAAVCPLHAHTLQWELFIVVAGQGTARVNDARHHIVAGDTFLQRPGTAHQLINTGADDLLVYIVADNHPADSTFYPESNKWQLKPQGKLFRMIEVEYFDGEE